MNLTQAEAQFLMDLPKRFEDDEPLVLGDVCLDYSRQLLSLDGREKFLLDVWRGGINLRKYRLQERTRQTTVLVRVDIGGPPHRNPDGEVILCPHIHIFREGYEDKWAYPLADYPFRNPDDIAITLEEFADFCKIVSMPSIQRRWT